MDSVFGIEFLSFPLSLSHRFHRTIYSCAVCLELGLVKIRLSLVKLNCCSTEMVYCIRNCMQFQNIICWKTQILWSDIWMYFWSNGIGFWSMPFIAYFCIIHIANFLSLQTSIRSLFFFLPLSHSLAACTMNMLNLLNLYSSLKLLTLKYYFSIWMAQFCCQLKHIICNKLTLFQLKLLAQ